MPWSPQSLTKYGHGFLFTTLSEYRFVYDASRTTVNPSFLPETLDRSVGFDPSMDLVYNVYLCACYEGDGCLVSFAPPLYPQDLPSASCTPARRRRFTRISLTVSQMPPCFLSVEPEKGPLQHSATTFPFWRRRSNVITQVAEIHSPALGGRSARINEVPYQMPENHLIFR